MDGRDRRYDMPEAADEEMIAEGVKALIRGLKSFPNNYTQIVNNIWEDMAANLAERQK